MVDRKSAYRLSSVSRSYKEKMLAIVRDAERSIHPNRLEGDSINGRSEDMCGIPIYAIFSHPYIFSLIGCRDSNSAPSPKSYVSI